MSKHAPPLIEVRCAAATALRGGSVITVITSLDGSRLAAATILGI